jgi:hypothetical protein
VIDLDVNPCHFVQGVEVCAVPGAHTLEKHVLLKWLTVVRSLVNTLDAASGRPRRKVLPEKGEALPCRPNRRRISISRRFCGYL